jgi:Protein of unknown function (DUF1077)
VTPPRGGYVAREGGLCLCRLCACIAFYLTTHAFCGACRIPAQFKPLQDDSGSISFIVPKLAFLAVQLVGLSLVLYKCNTMGLLPTEADWAVFNLEVRMVGIGSDCWVVRLSGVQFCKPQTVWGVPQESGEANESEQESVCVCVSVCQRDPLRDCSV